eukprot:Opistho-1_new@52254
MAATVDSCKRALECASDGLPRKRVHTEQNGDSQHECKTSSTALDAINEADDVRIKKIAPLIPPQILMEDFPLSPEALETVKTARNALARVIDGADDRLVVVVGPCSIHDVKAAMEYGTLLREQMHRLSADLLVIMRVYFEKPRTTVGWKGLINDPFLDDTFQINKGLRIARKLLLDLNETGVPAAVEFLDTITPQFLGDLVSWGAIGARTTESQVHRELASGLSCPVGFKNGTSGNVDIAIDAIRASCSPHRFLSVTKQGLAAIVSTAGNPHCHVILRGGSAGPNFSAEHVRACGDQLRKAKLPSRIMIDCSHGNSLKLHTNQPKVAHDIAEQLATGCDDIFGVMIESNLCEGRQNVPPGGPSQLEYGKSITDACVGWTD